MRSLLALALIVLTTTETQSQLSIPNRELGFVYSTGEPGALIKIALYIDFTCPDSKASFPTLLQVAKAFNSSEVQLRIHAFSLSFHRHSHTISKGANVLNAFKSPKQATVFDWISAAYDNIDSLTTSATVNKTDTEILNLLANLAHDVSGISTSDFISGVHNDDIDTLTRLDWKYGITRGVTGTPSFTVNDVFLNAEPTWTVAQWSNLINKLLKD